MKKALRISFIAAAFLMFTAGSQASVIYVPMNVTANQTSTWNWFSFGTDADGFGLWVNPGASLRLETYLGPVIGITEDGKTYLSSIPYGTEIGPSSVWATPAAAAYINDATHTTLNGNTVYAGVQLVGSDASVYYGWMQLVVSADGLTVSLTGMAYQDVAGTSLMAGVIDRQIAFEKPDFVEDLVTNDGSIGSTIPVNLIGVDFSMATGRMTVGTHYTTSNVPAGLQMEIAVTDSKHAVISFTGKATAHSEVDTRTDVTVNFLDAVFTGATASQIIDATRENLGIRFFDPYKIVYDDVTDLVCGAGGWQPFENLHYGASMGLWHDGTDMRIETYGLSVVGTMNLGKSLITPINEGTVIDSTSAWVTTGAWPNEPYINTSSYTTWNGKHKYAAIQILVGDAVLYGWLNLEVSADGKTMTLLDWAFNTQPKGAIMAGQKPSGVPVNGVEPQNFKASPNPFSNLLLITFSQPVTDPVQIEILDITGKLIYNESVESPGMVTRQVQLDGLSRGVYFLKIRSGNFTATTKMLRD